MLTGSATDVDPGFQLPGVGFATLFIDNQLNPGRHAALADIAHMGQFGQSGETLFQPDNLGLQRFDQLLAFEQFQVSDGDRTGQRVAGEGVAVKKVLSSEYSPKKAE